MGELKKRRIVLKLSANEDNCIYGGMISNGMYKLYLTKNPLLNSFWRMHHLYVISDDKITKGDYWINLDNNSLYSNRLWKLASNSPSCKKVIASTDILKTGRKIMPDGEIFDPNSNWDLKYHVKSGFGLERIQRDEFIPKIKREFVSIYMNLYNQGKYLTEILIDCDELNNNIVNIKLLKETFSLDELTDAFLQCNYDLRMMRAGDIRDWIKKNL